MVEEINGLVTAQTITLSLPWYMVDRVILSLRFTSNSVEHTDFGVDTALTNGIQLRYKGRQILLIQDLHDFTKFSYDFNRLRDDGAAAARSNVAVTRYSFDRFGDGLDLLNHNNWLEIIIGDDLSSSSNDDFTMVFEGWGL